ncbi:hypothetical protein NEOLEDRAFT_1151471 [Neolentinus lepideus HHB14362 ss-1]|uniref:DUF6533 domain-containing protein n=1 Tax=Neolentinus lepideus HHB14362 ss-1 TaxID=1314782 RepID=A0A165NYD9_9AGAM|nr:hypothetical protein NEOLEDRAFT_1151471 [Neolentinus lepideus HHB14362 ss-1]
MASEFQQLVQALDDIRHVNYVNAAALACLLYDICLTLEQEVLTVWRYCFCALQLMLNNDTLIVKTNTNASLHFFSCHYAMWFDLMLLLAVVSICYIYNCCYNNCGDEACYCLSTSSRDPLAWLSDYVRGKYIYWTCLSIMVVFLTRDKILTCTNMEGLYFVLLAYKCFAPAWHHGIKLYEMHHLSPMVHIFLRDGAAYLFVIFGGAAVAMTFLYVYHDCELILIGFSITSAIYSISVSRLILNIRNINKEGHETVTVELQILSV